MRPKRWLLVVGMLALPSVIQAQTVRGRVVDAETGEGIAQANVVVTGQTGRAFFTTTVENGDYELSLPEGGVFSIQVGRVGYRAAVADSLVVPDGTLFQMTTLALVPQPIVLDELNIRGRRRLTPGREWIERRQALGKGAFFSGAVLAARNPVSLTRFLAEETGLYVRYSERGVPQVTQSFGGGCVLLFLNEWPLNRTYNIGRYSEIVGLESMDLIPLDRIAAVEVYNNMREVPAGRLWFSDTGGAHPCGVINIWTWDSY